MTIAYGVTSSGFVAKPLSEISAEIDADLQAILGASAGTNADGTIPLASMAGQLKTMLVDGFSAQWDLQQAVVANLDPNQASAAAQDVIGSLTGAIRDAQSFSSVMAALSGTSATTLFAGRVGTVTSTAARFDSLSNVTLASLNIWVGSTSYPTVGALVTNGGDVYVVLVGGTAAGSGGPTGTGASIIDGGVTWAYVGNGTFGATTLFQAEQPGPIGAIQGALATISTPVAGWTGIFNYIGAATGALQETDAAFRARRNLELAADGNSTVNAIRAAILAVNQGSTDPNHQAPTGCTVFFNDTDITDANGLPPHSIEVMVTGGTAQDIANTIWATVSAGTATHGNTTSTVVDSQGNNQTVLWTIPVPTVIYVIAVINYDPTQWTSSASPSAAVVQAALSAILTYGATYAPGVDVRTSPLIAAFMTGPSQVDTNGNALAPAAAGSAPTAGMVEVSSILIGLTSNPISSANVSIGTRQVASFQLANMSITASAETP